VLNETGGNPGDGGRPDGSVEDPFAQPTRMMAEQQQTKDKAEAE
jgi:hypothetical protein